MMMMKKIMIKLEKISNKKQIHYHLDKAKKYGGLFNHHVTVLWWVALQIISV